MQKNRDNSKDDEAMRRSGAANEASEIPCSGTDRVEKGTPQHVVGSSYSGTCGGGTLSRNGICGPGKVVLIP